MTLDPVQLKLYHSVNLCLDFILLKAHCLLNNFVMDDEFCFVRNSVTFLTIIANRSALVTKNLAYIVGLKLGVAVLWQRFL